LNRIYTRFGSYLKLFELRKEKGFLKNLPSHLFSPTRNRPSRPSLPLLPVFPASARCSVTQFLPPPFPFFRTGPLRALSQLRSARAPVAHQRGPQCPRPSALFLPSLTVRVARLSAPLFPFPFFFPVFPFFPGAFLLQSPPMAWPCTTSRQCARARMDGNQITSARPAPLPCMSQPRPPIKHRARCPPLFSLTAVGARYCRP